MKSFENVRLGFRPSPYDERTLRAERYIADVAIPKVVDFGLGVSYFPMFKNDSIGDCAVAAPGHMMKVWTRAASGRSATIRDADIVSAYSAVTGYDPDDPSTDRGSVPLDVLRYWRKVGIANRKITAFASVKPTGAEVRRAIWTFGGLYVGVNLPRSAQGQKRWDVVPGGGPDTAPGSWGGHAISIHGYKDGAFRVATWGERIWVSEAFFDAYAIEAWAVLSPSWLKGDRTPNGFDLDALKADLAAVAS